MQLKQVTIMFLVSCICMAVLNGCGSSENSGRSQSTEYPKKEFQTEEVDSTKMPVGETQKTKQEEEPIQTQETLIDETTGYKEAYRTFLEDYKNMGYSEDTRFKLLYVDGDDIPEIILCSSGGEASGSHVYTYYNGEVVDISPDSSYGVMGYFYYVEKGNCILSGSMSRGYDSSIYVSIENGQAVTLGKFWNDEEAARGDITYKYNDEAVSEAEYKNYQSAITGGREFSYVSYEEYLNNTEENIAASLQ